jgi:large subunit ribosomal protein L11
MEFCKGYNEKTKGQEGTIIPVVITVYTDRTYSFIMKTPLTSVLLKQAAKIAKGSGEPNKTKVGEMTKDQIKNIAQIKMPDLNANTLDAAMKIIEGTARSMGIKIV